MIIKSTKTANLMAVAGALLVSGGFDKLSEFGGTKWI